MGKFAEGSELWCPQVCEISAEGSPRLALQSPTMSAEPFPVEYVSRIAVRRYHTPSQCLHPLLYCFTGTSAAQSSNTIFHVFPGLQLRLGPTPQLDQTQVSAASTRPQDVRAIGPCGSSWFKSHRRVLLLGVEPLH